MLPLLGKIGGLFSKCARAAAGDGVHGVSKFLTKIKVSDRPVATSGTPHHGEINLPADVEKSGPPCPAAVAKDR